MKAASIIKVLLGFLAAIVLTAMLVLCMTLQGFELNPIISCTGFVAHYYTDEESYTVGGGTLVGAEIGSEKIKQVEINWIAGDVVIKLSDKDELSISETMEVSTTSSGDGIELRYRIVDGILTIQPTKSGCNVASFIEKDLTVVLPAGTSPESISIDSGASNVILTGVTADKLDVNMGAGNVTLDKCVLRSKLDLDMGAGNVNIDFSDSETIGGEKADLEIDMGAGNVTFKGRANKIDVDMGAGDVTLVMLNAPSEIDVDSAAGKLNVTLPRTVSGFKAENSSIASSVNVKGFEVSVSGHTCTYGDGKCIIKHDCAAGDINIFAGDGE